MGTGVRVSSRTAPAADQDPAAVRAIVGTCGFCSERLLWARGEGETQVSLDPGPHVDGRTPLVERRGMQPLAVDVTPGAAAAARAGGRSTYRRHADTCRRSHLWTRASTVAAGPAARAR